MSKRQSGVPSPNMDDSKSKDQSEGEGIQVAIRMRPLNSKEGGKDNENVGSRVWKVLKRHSSVTQTTPLGQPLPERVMNRNFFVYDKTFGEDSTTKQIYDGVAKNIVSGVVNGLNGTIFAYGQTSSGKTFTMQGSGGYGGMDSSVDNGLSPGDNNVPGIVHMAAKDIFQHIENVNLHGRVFLLRVSFLEIYNEEVRDLLVSGAREPNVLAIREDPQRGVFVRANENIVTSFTGLLDTLMAGQKNRSIASTLMNENSSRSHTIFRITVESRKKPKHKGNDEDEDDEIDDDDYDDKKEIDDSVLVSTLNLVDLAGSESVRHTGATGDRMKEGAKINQSLLTLSRVMASLGQANPGHINFRDSKLTRILQPSLSGNARMAVICCATPSALYLEETRSTLQFAARAKLVKTNAKINQVIDERSLIKKLQRELAILRQKSPNEELCTLRENNIKLERDKVGLQKRLSLYETNLIKSKLRLRQLHEQVFRKRELDVESQGRRQRRRLSDGFVRSTSSMNKTPSPMRSHKKPWTADSKAIHLGASSKLTKEALIWRKALSVKSSENMRLSMECKENNAMIEKLQQEMTKECIKFTKNSKNNEKDEKDVHKIIDSFQKEVSTYENSNKNNGDEIEYNVTFNENHGEANVEHENEKKTRIENNSSSKDDQRSDETHESTSITRLHEFDTTEDTYQYELDTMNCLLRDLRLILKETSLEKDEERNNLDSFKSNMDSIEQRFNEMEENIFEGKKELCHTRMELQREKEINSKIRNENNEIEINLTNLLLHFEGQKDIIECLRLEKQTFQTTIKDLQDEVVSSHREAIEVSNEHNDTQNKLEETRNELYNSKTEVNHLKKEKEKIVSKCNALSIELTDLSKVLTLTKQENVDLKSQYDEMISERDQHDMERKELLESVDSLKHELSKANDCNNDLNEQLIKAAQSRKEKDSCYDNLKHQNNELSKEVEVLKKDLSLKSVELCNVRENVDALKNEMTEINSLNSTLQEEKNMVMLKCAQMEETLGNMNEQCEDIKGNLKYTQKVFDEKQTQCNQFEGIVKVLVGEKEKMLVEIFHLKETIESYNSERNVSVSIIKDLQEQMKFFDDNFFLNVVRSYSPSGSSGAVAIHSENVFDQNEELSSCKKFISKFHELLIRYGVLGNEGLSAEDIFSLKSLTKLELHFECIYEKDIIISEGREVIAQLKGDINNANAKLVQYSLHCSEKPLKSNQSSELDSLRAEISDLKQLLANANDSVSEARSSALAAEEELEEKERELEEAVQMASDRDEAARVALERVKVLEGMQNSSDKCGEKDELMRDMELLYDEKLVLEARLEEQENSHKRKEKELRARMEEEQRALVAGAESSMAEIRDKLMHADSKLSQKKIEVSSLQKDIKQFQESIRKSNENCARLETSRMEQLEELISIKRSFDTLQKQNNDFVQSNNQHKLKIEAQNKTISQLEEKINELTLLLSEADVELNSRKQEIEFMQNDKGRMINQMRASKQNLVREKELAISKLKEELARLQVASTQSEGQIAAAKNVARDYKEQFDKLKNQVSSFKKNITNETESLRERISLLDEEKKAMQSQLSQRNETNDEFQLKMEKVKKERDVAKQEKHNIEKEVKSLHNLNTKLKLELDEISKSLEIPDEKNLKEVEASKNEIKRLKRRMHQMKEELNEKESRIKKLEKVRLTKEQCNALKKLKEERATFKEKFERADEELLKLRSEKEDGKGKDTNERIQTLETKLRKYVAHCKQLESERAAIADILKSFPPSNDTSRIQDDFSGAVHSLCARLRSAEEECRELASAEKRISSFMMEVDRLRSENTNLQKNLAGVKEQLTTLETSESDLNSKWNDARNKLNALERQRDDLRRIVDSAKKSSKNLRSEKERQIHYLEQENTQLMKELKEAHKEVRITKSKLDEMSNGIDRDINEVFSENQHSDAELKPPMGKTKRLHFKSSSKSTNIIDLGESSKMEDGSSANTLSGTPTKSSKKSRLSLTPKIFKMAVQKLNSDTELKQENSFDLSYDFFDKRLKSSNGKPSCSPESRNGDKCKDDPILTSIQNRHINSGCKEESSRKSSGNALRTPEHTSEENYKGKENQINIEREERGSANPMYSSNKKRSNITKQIDLNECTGDDNTGDCKQM